MLEEAAIVNPPSDVSSSCPDFTSNDSSFDTPSSESDVALRKNRRLPNSLKPYFTKIFDSDELRFMESAEYKAVSFLEHPVNLNLWVDKPTTGPIEKIIDDDFFSDTSSCNSIDVDLVP